MINSHFDILYCARTEKLPNKGHLTINIYLYHTYILAMCALTSNVHTDEHYCIIRVHQH